jgi:predicted nucleic acid-binding protein
MIVDSSVWIEYLRGTRSAGTARLRDSLSRRASLRMPSVVYMEVLRGARDAFHFARIQMQLEKIAPLVLPNPHETCMRAAALYARCRWSGITIRNSNDCFIAACAIETELPLLHADRDFERIATIEPKLKFA